MEGTLVLSTLKEKKWRRLVARGGDGSGQPPKLAAARRAAGTAPGPAMLRTSVGTAVLGTRKTKTAAALKTRRKK
jgi:hypothetical protein